MDMNIVVIFAGGVGKRMNTNGTPKQFLEIDEVPIIIHTLRVDENSDNINNSDNDSEDSENLNQIKLKRKQVIEKNLKNRRHTLNLGIGESLIGYRAKQRDRKTTQRIKKLGNVYSDFVI